jgi:hypothetical protein
MRLTDGLVVLLLIAAYVERRPFRALEHRLLRSEASLTRRLAEVRQGLSEQLEDARRQTARELAVLHLEHVEAQVTRRHLHGLLVQHFDQVGNLMDLVVPERANPVLRATIEIRLASAAVRGADDDDVYHHRYIGEFAIRQSEYVMGIVASKGHLDRLRDANAPIHEIFVLADRDVVTDASVHEIIAKYGIRFQYVDERTSIFRDARIEKIEDTTELWRPTNEQDQFPLTLLRASLPVVEQARQWSVRLTYQLPLSKREGFSFWTASRPTYLHRITINAAQLRGVTGMKFERFMPNFDRTSTSDVGSEQIYSVTVANWVLKGHGVILTWQRD